MRMLWYFTLATAIAWLISDVVDSVTTIITHYEETVPTVLSPYEQYQRCCTRGDT